MPWSALETTIVPVPGSSLPTTMAEPLSCLSTRAPEMMNQRGRQNETEERPGNQAGCTDVKTSAPADALMVSRAPGLEPLTLL